MEQRSENAAECTAALIAAGKPRMEKERLPQKLFENLQFTPAAAGLCSLTEWCCVTWICHFYSVISWHCSNTYGNEERDRIWDFHLRKMINNNQTCAAGQDSVPYVTCMLHVLEEWLGVEQLEDYLNFANHLLWVFTPLILLILPYFTIFLLYLTIIFLHIYKRKNVLKEAYSHNLWDGARKTVATLWDGHAAVWHGYEVHGMEKIPEGPALIIFYHGAIPIDFYYFMAKIFIHKGRTCRVVADHFVFKIPGFSLLLDVFCALHGPREKCVEILRSGHLLAISPGGVREALLSDETYNIIWGNRKGFAQVAIDAKVVLSKCEGYSSERVKHVLGVPECRWLSSGRRRATAVIS